MSPSCSGSGACDRADPRKGLDTLLEAMERLPGGGPPLALVGALGPEADRLAADAWRRRLRLVPERPGRRCRSRVAVPAGCGGRPALDARGLRFDRAGGDGVRGAAGRHRGREPSPAHAGRRRAGAARRSRGDCPAPSSRCSAEPVSAARMRHAGIDRASGYTWERTAAMTAAVYEQVALRSGSHPR